MKKQLFYQTMTEQLITIKTAADESQLLFKKYNFKIFILKKYQV